jgi:hypothetical protein
MTDIIVNDLRAPKTSDTPEIETEVKRGYVIAYPDHAGDLRRAVVLSAGSGEVTVLDGPNAVTLTAAQRAAVTVLAKSADAYAKRVAREARDLRRNQSWCDVPTELVRTINTTPINDATRELFVVGQATRTYRLQPTNIGLRRKGSLVEQIQTSFMPAQVGTFDRRSFEQLHVPNGNGHKVTLRLLDELPAS